MKNVANIKNTHTRTHKKNVYSECMMTLFDTGLIQSALAKNVPINTSNVSKAVLSFFARL